MQSTAYKTTAPDAVALLEGDALYGRTSSDDQAEDGTIGAQQDFLRQYGKLYCPKGVREYWDDGVSGTVPLAERPEGERLIKDVRAGLVKRVHFTKVNRLGRSLAVLMDAHTVLDALGATIKSATEPFDTATPMGRFIFQLLASMAELDRSLLLDTLTQGRDRVAREGRWTGGPLPYAYDVPPLAPTPAEGEEGTSGKRRRKNTSRPLVLSTVVVPQAGAGWTEVQVMYDVHLRLAAGSSLVAECARLNALGVPAGRKYADRPRRPGRWTPTALGRQIKSEIYMGRRVLKSKRGVIVHAVPPIVTPESRAAALARIASNKALPKGAGDRRYLLRGLVVCAGCGGAYVGGTGGHSKGAPPVHYYRCAGAKAWRHADPADRCRGKGLPALWLERAVWAQCLDFARRPGETLAEIQAQLRGRLQDAAAGEAERANLRRGLADKERERERVLDSYRVGRTTAAETDRDLAKITTEAAELRRGLEALDARRDVAEAMEAHLTEAGAVLRELQARADDLEALETGGDVGRWEEQRRMAARLVAVLEVTTRGTGRGSEAEVAALFTFGGRASLGAVRVPDGTTARRTVLCPTPDAPPVLVRRLRPAAGSRGGGRSVAPGGTTR